MIDPFAEVTALAGLIRIRELSPVEVAEFYIDRIDTFNPQLNAFTWQDHDRLLADAREAERLLMTDAEVGRFHGVPLAIKDVHSVAGQPCVKGSWALSDAPAPENDLVIDRFLAAGFLPLGRTAVPELAGSVTCESERFGITRNPWNLDHTPAGSTGGGAAAVAAGLAPVTTGTDGGGSIRLPASACGLVGLKPTRALLPHRLPNWELSSVDGFLTRRVRDAAAILDAIATPDPYGWIVPAVPAPRYEQALNHPVAPMRIAVMLEPVGGGPVDPDCLTAVEAVAAELEGMGHLIEPAPAPIIDPEALRLFVEVAMPAGLQLAEYADESRLSSTLQARLHLADSFTVRDYTRHIARMKRLMRDVVAQWYESFDLLLTPTMPIRVPRIDEICSPDPEAARRIAGMASFARFVNATGLPAISVPTHTDSAGLPVGVQLVGWPFSEDVLLAMGAQLERRYGWPARTPSLTAHPPGQAGGSAQQSSNPKERRTA